MKGKEGSGSDSTQIHHNLGGGIGIGVQWQVTYGGRMKEMIARRESNSRTVTPYCIVAEATQKHTSPVPLSISGRKAWRVSVEECKKSGLESVYALPEHATNGTRNRYDRERPRRYHRQSRCWAYCFGTATSTIPTQTER